ncbi:MAG: hypothetical protein J4F31_05150 [Flavobacteriales bacterium]|nr:hypothetical protein [Flavobacteriales bacterium]
MALRTRGPELLNQQLERKRVFIEHTPLGDFEIWNNRMFAGTLDGFVVQMNERGKRIDSVFTGVVTDLFLWRDTLSASTPDGIVRLNSNLEIVERIEHPDVLQSVQIGRYLVFSTLNGLFAYDQGRIVTLIPNVEFNKKALYLYGHNLFAGSVQGLYQIKRYYLEDVILPNANLNIIDPGPDRSYWPIGIGLLLALLLTIAIQMPRFRKKEEQFVPIEPYKMEFLKELILENPNIQSVNDLAEKLNTSTVQLNRKLKKQGTTPGKLINKVKKEISRSLYEQGTPVKEISRRVGYSERYVKEKFLRESS